ncbi:hypothetical protein G7Y89_g4275 [Cudoniella acicularis]|uniref:Uncharacterized protein n=1 Tax=Cudoniella acicularis TaxID=354080 RepID=A0A8H4RR77_9HELO|nr:hypothetical protein G7Y89_g4275 [Cudoniella acicularis]
MNEFSQGAAKATSHYNLCQSGAQEGSMKPLTVAGSNTTFGDESFTTLSTTTSTMSKESHNMCCLSNSTAEKLQHVFCPRQEAIRWTRYGFSGWYDQPRPDKSGHPCVTQSQEQLRISSSDEAQLQNRNVSLSIKRSKEPSASDQRVLAEAKAVAEREAVAYWIWDEEVGRYKHYDEGCSEPVWYNPPV